MRDTAELKYPNQSQKYIQFFVFFRFYVAGMILFLPLLLVNEKASESASLLLLTPPRCTKLRLFAAGPGSVRSVSPLCSCVTACVRACVEVV
jgi:hypothetical protein